MSDHDIGPVPGNQMLSAEVRDKPVESLRQADVRYQPSSRGDPLGQDEIVAGKVLAQCLWSSVECISPSEDFYSGSRVSRTSNLNGQAETVQELRPQLSLFRVHGADEDEACRVAMRYPFPLHHILPRGSHVEDRVHQMIREEIHLVDEKNAAMGTCQKAGTKHGDSLTERLREIEASDDHILRGV